jgi:hypothetical protein
MHKVKFLAHKTGISKQTGNPYNLLELAIGYRNATASCELDTKITESLKEGDDVEIGTKLDVDFNGNVKTVVTSLKKL